MVQGGGGKIATTQPSDDADNQKLTEGFGGAKTFSAICPPRKCLADVITAASSGW